MSMLDVSDYAKFLTNNIDSVHSHSFFLNLNVSLYIGESFWEFHGFYSIRESVDSLCIRESVYSLCRDGAGPPIVRVH